MTISRQKVSINIKANEDGSETYSVSVGCVGVFRKWSRLTLEQAEQQAADFADEVRRQRTGRPVVVRDFCAA